MERSKVQNNKVQTTSTTIPTNVVRPVQFVNSTPPTSTANSSCSAPSTSSLNIECRSSSNGHSSPDSGVNDMNDERPAAPSKPEFKKPTNPVTAAASGDGSAGIGRMIPTTQHRPPQAGNVAIPTMHLQRQFHKITLSNDERFRIKMGDTERHISGELNYCTMA